MKKQQPTLLGIHRFDPTQVLYLIGETNYSHLHLVTGEIILFSRTLKWFEDQWPTFLRIHKQTLINPAFIQEVKMAKSTRRSSYLIMRNQAQFAISRRRLIAVVETLSPRKTATDSFTTSSLAQERTRLKSAELTSTLRGVSLR